MSDIVIDIPDNLAKEAEATGILSSESISSLLRDEIRRRRVNKLFIAADKLAATKNEINEDDVTAEVKKYRQEKRSSE